MGRSSFEIHSKKFGLFDELESKGHKIIKIVLSKSWSSIPDDYNKTPLTILCQSWSDVKLKLSNDSEINSKISQAWNIGGPSLYEDHILDCQDSKYPGKLHLTQLEQTFDCDTFYPMKYLSKLSQQDDKKCNTNICNQRFEENGVYFTFQLYQL
jgi:dihydrofolate reductase